MKRKIFLMVFLFLLVKPVIICFALDAPADSAGTETKSDSEKEKKPLDDSDSLPNPFAPQLPVSPQEVQKEIEQQPTTVEENPSGAYIPPLIHIPEKVGGEGQQPPTQEVKQSTVKEDVHPPEITISGLIWNTERPQAIINKQIVSVGDQIEEWTIQKIDKNGIEISFHGKNILIPVNFSVQSSSHSVEPASAIKRDR